MDAQTFAKAGEIWFRLECIIELAARRREQQAGSRTALRRPPGGSKGSGHLLRTPERRLRSSEARGGCGRPPPAAPQRRGSPACLRTSCLHAQVRTLDDLMVATAGPLV